MKIDDRWFVCNFNSWYECFKSLSCYKIRVKKSRCGIFCCCKISPNFLKFWWKLAKFAPVRSRLYRRIFEIFLPNRLDLVEQYPKCFFNFFSNFFSRSKFDDKVGIFGLCDKFLNIFFVEFSEIWRFWTEIRAYTHRPWRENPKIRRYSRKMIGRKSRNFRSFSLTEKKANLSRS